MGKRWAVLALILAATVGNAQQTQLEIDQAIIRDLVSLDRISSYISELTTVEGSFVQYNSDGSVSTGVFQMNRPWHGRLEYDPPEPTLMIASGRRVAIFDRKSNSGPKIYPLRSTPLFTILAKDVDLSDPRFFEAHLTGQDFSEVHLKADFQNVEGRVELVFANWPIALAGWTYVDEFGQRTTLVLSDLKEGVEFKPGHFSIEAQGE